MQIEVEGARVEAGLPGRQGRLLFAYLLLCRDRGTTRDELTALLWPERPPPSAGTTLRALLSKIRGALGTDAIQGTRGLRMMLGDDVWVDVEAAVAAVERVERAIAGGERADAWAAAQLALSIVSRRFLPGDGGDWVEDKRRELEDLRLVALEQLARVALELGGSELVAAERAARALVDAAPYRENGYLLLMQVLAACGNQAEAVRVYDRARTLLLDELGIPPTAKLRALNERLLLAGGGGEALAVVPSLSVTRLPPLLTVAERTPIIGRETELGRLTDRFEAALDHGPVVATISGEAGIGKTRLVGELARATHGAGALVLYGSAPRECSAYQPFLEAFRQYIGATAADRLASLSAIDPPILARLLPELFETGAARPAELVADEQTGRLRTFAALTRVVEHLNAQQPLVLVLDDMHWSDSASVQLLSHMLRTARAGPLFVIIGYRPGESPVGLGEALDAVERRTPVERISLPPLNEEAVETLVSAWAGTGAPASFARGLHERTEGNPFFIANVLRHLVQAGAIDPQVRRWATAADISMLGVPREVRELIEIRLGAFDDQEREVLAAAAVIGHEFHLSLVEKAVHNPSEALDALENALRAGLVVEDPQRPAAFRFAHALVREAIYAGLSSARRVRVHLAVGRAMESAHAGDLPRHSAELARHFLVAARAGEDPAPAIEYSLVAGAHARQVFANDQAEAHYRSALELLDQAGDHGQRARAGEGLADMLAIRAQYSGALIAYTQALTDVSDDRVVDRARICRRLGQVHTRAREPDAAEAAFDRAELLLRPLTDSPEVIAEAIDLALDRLTLLYWQNKPDAMHRVIVRIRPSIERGGTPAQRVRLLHSTLVREMRLRRYRLTRHTVELARQALAAAEQTGDPTAIANAHFQLGFTLVFADQADEPIRHLAHAYESAVRSGDLMFQARVLTYLSVAHRRRASLEDAHLYAQQAFDAAIAADMPEYQGLARANLAWVAIQREDVEAADERAQFALGSFAELPFQMPFFAPFALWPLVAVAVIRRDFAAAVARAEQLLDPQYRPLPSSVAKLLKAASACPSPDSAEAATALLRALELGDHITLSTSTGSPAMRYSGHQSATMVSSSRPVTGDPTISISTPSGPASN
jgi:DNA-binding SARP family transcriptional activator